MEIKMYDHTVGAYYGDLHVNNEMVNQITRNTAETWQPDRKEGERGRNTRQGKVAEEIVEKFMTSYFASELSMVAYDNIRNDNYEKHAPFDLLIWENGSTDIEPIEISIQRDISNTQNKFVRLSEYTRKLCRDSNVKIAEVKSTKIRDALKTGAGFNGNYDDPEEVIKLINEIKRRDDIFCYPFFKRSEAAVNYTISDYCLYAKEQEASLAPFAGETLRRRVIDLEMERQCCDVFIRVYIDFPAKRGFVIGWMQKERLLDYSVIFKRMRKENKSERALYFAKNLREVNGMDALLDLFRKRLCVYASPYTRTNFYHKTKECQFLKNVNESDLIAFESEEEAIADGRYTNRCRFCF